MNQDESDVWIVLLLFATGFLSGFALASGWA
jgi:hypothetical protein